MHIRRDVLQGLSAVGASTVLQISPFAGLTAEAASVLSFEVPRGACDSHVHVFDPVRFPYAAKRVYTPPQALTADLAELLATLRMERVVIVQPSVYGADNACTLDAVRTLGERARAVVVIDTDTSRTEIDDMAAAGARGIRLNLHTTPDGKLDPDASKRVLDRAVEQIQGRGWHIQFYTLLPVIAALKGHIEQLPFPVVFDHFGSARAAQGTQQQGFDALLDLVKSGRAYVKISGSYRVSTRSPDFPDATPLAQALIAAHSDRIVWGSDWPHPDSSAGRGRPLAEITAPVPVDDVLVLNQLATWTNDAAIREKILVHNPAALYGFETKATDAALVPEAAPELAPV